MKGEGMMKIRVYCDMREWGLGVYLSIRNELDRIMGTKFMFLLHIGCITLSIVGKERR